MDWTDPPGGKPWGLFGLAGASVLLNLVLMFRGAPAPEPVVLDDVCPDWAAAQAPIEQAEDIELASADATAEPVEAPVLAPIRPEGLDVVRATVKNSLAYTFSKALPDDRDDVVNAIATRLFVWDLDMRRDLQAGDEVALAYTWEDDLATIEVARYESRKLNKTLTAYHFQATGDAHASWWDIDGNEVGRRFKSPPIQQYEQVVALLGDGRGHKGMDFKGEVGTPVMAVEDATVVRTNWNGRFNGNCVELKYKDGTLARYLHLDSIDVKAGQRVAAGTTIGALGNTGRSFAPHLHYELEKGGRTLDPLDEHPTWTRTLPAEDMSRFQALVADRNSWLDADA